jgi:hypothetical protein
MKNHPETLTDYQERAKLALLAAAENPNCRVHISAGNTKIGSADNVSLLPIFTCGNCKECKNYCYAIRSCRRGRDSVLKAWAENTYMAKHHRVEFFEQIHAHLAKKPGGFFRWHVGGEIMDPGYFRCIVETAKKFPSWRFWMYTKEYSLVNHWRTLPDNLVVMYSKWSGVECPNPYGRPEFRTRLYGMSMEPFKGLWRCPGSCQACIAAGRGCVAGETTYNDEH